MDWKEKLLSSDAARAAPQRAAELIALAEAALAGDTRALLTGMETTLANDCTALGGLARLRQPAKRPTDTKSEGWS